MEQKKPPVDIRAELNNQMTPWIEYLIENYNNPNKINSCLDVSSENIRFLESLINSAESYLKDFKTLKKLVIAHEEKRKSNINEPNENQKSITDDCLSAEHE